MGLIFRARLRETRRREAGFGGEHPLPFPIEAAFIKARNGMIEKTAPLGGHTERRKNRSTTPSGQFQPRSELQSCQNPGTIPPRSANWCWHAHRHSGMRCTGRNCTTPWSASQPTSPSSAPDFFGFPTGRCDAGFSVEAFTNQPEEMSDFNVGSDPIPSAKYIDKALQYNDN